MRKTAAAFLAIVLLGAGVTAAAASDKPSTDSKSNNASSHSSTVTELSLLQASGNKVSGNTKPGPHPCPGGHGQLANGHGEGCPTSK